MKYKYLKLLPIAAASMAPFLFTAAHAQEAASSPGTAQAAAPVQDDLSQYDTADKLWAHIQERPQNPPHTREEAAAYFQAKSAAAKEFEKLYPRDSHAPLAKMAIIQADEVLAQLGDTSVNLQQDEQDLKTLIAAPDTAPKVKADARFMLLIMHYRQSQGKPTQETADEMAAFVSDFPTDPRAPQLQEERLHILEKIDPAQGDALLAEMLKDPNPQMVQIAQGEEKKRDIQKKPLDLEFTAVDGSDVDLSKMRGHVVLIDFWATWCGPCMGEVPNVVATYNQYHSQGFDIVGISLDQDKDKLASVTKEKGMVWPQYFDGQGWKNKISSGFGIESIPTMWLVDKKGMVVDLNAREDLKEQVEKLLAE